MDVILARLDPRQLRVHCSDALQQELAKTLEFLELALAASKRAEEVQHASRKLDVYEFLDDSALLQRLDQIDSLRLQLSISIDHIVSSAKGKLSPDLARSVKHDASVASGLQSILGLSDATIGPLNAAPPTAAVTDLSAAERSDELSPLAAAASSSRKRKLSVSMSNEQPQQQTPTAATKKFEPAFKCVSPTSRLGKAIQTAYECSIAAKKRKAGDRIQGFTTLSAMSSVVVNRLDGTDAAGVREAMDALAYLFATEVSMLVKAKPVVKRPVALKKLKAIQDVQSKFPAFAALFDKSVTILSKFMELAFPLSGRATDELKRRVRAALKDVKAWESGPYSVPDFLEKMRFVKQVLDSNCENWTPKKDPSVQELLDALIARLGGFKDSIAQGKRKETLLAWRAEVKARRAPSRVKDKKDASNSNSGSSSNESGLAASSRVALNASRSSVLQSPASAADMANAQVAMGTPMLSVASDAIDVQAASGSANAHKKSRVVSGSTATGAFGAAAMQSSVTANGAASKPEPVVPQVLVSVYSSSSLSKKKSKKSYKKSRKKVPIAGATKPKMA